ncbi:hypothetical protein EVJ58_g3197 [Rhodofomes roseus]|uniref:Lysophospholipase n=1 Tax=Rhodofomes roseus TaxID=34475 RepID=A0A4Y9YMB1_9APHY|nr:hypothetical protein EVJ58_g3197 [Rhodofomes roseus]
MLSLLFLAYPLFSPLLVRGQLAAAEAYTPTRVACPPDTSLVRLAGTGTSQSLNPSESAYVSSRQTLVLPSAWQSYLTTVQQQIEAQNVSALPSYVSDILSAGGGYRAAIVGAGALNALDGRNASAIEAGTGGLLQAATYITGLSGGNWLVTSLAQADFPTLPELVFQPNDVSGWGGWNAEYSLASPTSNTVQGLAYDLGLITEIQGKLLAGYPVSIVDLWARILARHFTNGTSANNYFDSSLPHGAGITFSSLTNLSTFVSYSQPFPIVVADSRSWSANFSNLYPDSDDNVPLTNPVYEFSVYEMGSFDPSLAAFTPMQYLGTEPGSDTCTVGFDQLSFIAATSSNIFSSFNYTSFLNGTNLLTPLLELFTQLSNDTESLDWLVTSRVPNPFYGLNEGTYLDSNATELALVDGGDDGEGIPFTPLLAKARGVDVIWATDGSGNITNWANGYVVSAAQARTELLSAYDFPPVPTDTATWLDEGLTTHPTFFGCNSSSPVPLLIYLANGAPPLGQAPLTNITTVQEAFEADDIEAAMSQMFDLTTQGMATEADGVWAKDPEWPACLACAVVDRSRAKAGVERSGVCETCMQKYCWS